MMMEFEAPDGRHVLGEATTSWSFVGAGLRLSAELLGPEYSMSWNTLDAGLKLFFSREVRGKSGEDLVEKQNAEVGSCRSLPARPLRMAMKLRDRHFVQAFLHRTRPAYTFDDGVDVVRLLMCAYMSAEQERTLSYPPPGVDTFVPQVAQGAWRWPLADARGHRK